MKKLVIIGANDFQTQLILRAKELGFETHVFAWEDGAVGKHNADFFYPISIVELAEILKYCRAIKPAGICSIGSDLASITVNYLGRELGLHGYNTEACCLKSTNKFYMRKALQEAGLDTPYFRRVFDPSELEGESLLFPLIVKPTDRSGSRAVSTVYNIAQLNDAILTAVKSSFENAAIVEGLIHGQEYSCEAISSNGKHTVLAVTKKFTTGSPHFIETGHVEPSGLDVDMLQNAKQKVFQALDALEIQFGASHSEFRLDCEGNLQFIEVAARMGGDCIGSDLVKLSTGYDFIQMVIDIAVGALPNFAISSHFQTALVKFIFSKEDLCQLEVLKQQYPQELYRISGISPHEHHLVVDSGSRLGYYIMISNKKDPSYLLKATQLM